MSEEAGSTEEHRAPDVDARVASEPALIVAFPEAAALPLPSTDTIGRQWFVPPGIADPKISGAHLSVARASLRACSNRRSSATSPARFPEAAKAPAVWSLPMRVA